MALFYAQLDNDQFLTIISKDPQKGFTEVVVPDAWLDSFTKYFNKFRLVNGLLKNPNNLPEVSVDDLNNRLQQLIVSNDKITNELTQAGVDKDVSSTILQSVLANQVKTNGAITQLSNTLAGLVSTMTAVNATTK